MAATAGFSFALCLIVFAITFCLICSIGDNGAVGAFALVTCGILGTETPPALTTGTFVRGFSACWKEPNPAALGAACLKALDP